MDAIHHHPSDFFPSLRHHSAKKCYKLLHLVFPPNFCREHDLYRFPPHPPHSVMTTIPVSIPIEFKSDAFLSGLFFSFFVVLKISVFFFSYSLRLRPQEQLSPPNINFTTTTTTTLYSVLILTKINGNPNTRSLKFIKYGRQQQQQI